jgi:hypothetical protein
VKHGAILNLRKIETLSFVLSKNDLKNVYSLKK